MVVKLSEYVELALKSRERVGREGLPRVWLTSHMRDHVPRNDAAMPKKFQPEFKRDEAT